MKLKILGLQEQLKIRRHFYFAFSLLYRRQSLKRLKVSLKMPKSVWQKCLKSHFSNTLA